VAARDRRGHQNNTRKTFGGGLAVIAYSGNAGECRSPAFRGRPARRAGALFWRGLTMALLATGLAAAAKDCHALWGDRIEPFAAAAVTYDDNVFRLSGQADPTAVLGSSSKSDTYTTTSIGLNFDLPVSRQRFLGGLSFNDNRYDQFTGLNFTERHARALWKWVAGNDLSGELGYTRDRALASFSNVQGGVQSGIPNPLDTKKAFANAAYMLGARWRLRGDLVRLDQANGATALQVNDGTIDSIGLGLHYVSRAGNTAGLDLQTQDGQLPNPQDVNGTLVDNSYQQDRINLMTEWTLSGHSRLRASAGLVDRSYEQLPERDYDTGTYHVDYEWKPTGKITLVAAAQRDIGAPDEINAGVNTSFVLVEGIALRPEYRVSEKTNIAGILDYSNWDYLGDAGTVLGTVSPRSDRVRTVAVALGYQALRNARVDFGYRYESRTSTDAFGDYTVNIFSLGARLAF
jgi:exopolysaccharide biosynthesis operon protein EpsL